ncbi:hypothetical protein EMPS_01538 [Entomortierella parvispora]|uniref:Uncharacterized protein n=1 Tax=Entomortierella parvispora TaxID=205924 RepID=A0A9P3H363_9FUNG|nr:hypothetical protein EMPS_01538 [Entomortierella parvispora]
MGASFSRSPGETTHQQEHSRLTQPNTNTNTNTGRASPTINSPHEEFHPPYPRPSKQALYQRQLEMDQELARSMAEIRMASGQVHNQQVAAMNQHAIDLAIQASLEQQHDQYHYLHQRQQPVSDVTMDMIRESSGTHLL